MPKAGPALRLSKIKVATIRRNGDGLSAGKIFMADSNTSRGASCAVSLFIIRISCCKRRSLSSHAEHVATWDIAVSRAVEVKRFSAIAARVSREMCSSILIVNALAPDSTERTTYQKIQSHYVHFAPPCDGQECAISSSFGV